MITKMTRYTIACISDVSARMLESLQRTGVVDIRRSVRPIDSRSKEMMERALEIKEEIAGTRLKKELGGCEKEIASLEKELSGSAPWGDFSQQTLQKLSEGGCTVRFHKVPLKKFDPRWAEEIPLGVIAEYQGECLFTTFQHSGSLSPAEIGIGGEVPPPRPTSRIKAELEAANARRQEIDNRLGALPAGSAALQKEYDALMARLDVYLAAKAGEVEGQLQGYADIFEGYAPSEDNERIKEVLESLPVYYSCEDASEDDTPVKLRNNWFTRQFEVFTDMYGVPLYGEFDPTPILGPFFLLFFSMCMGDAGYGLLLIAISQFLRKKMPLSGLGKMHSLIMLLGIGTFVVGIFLGTFFGISLFKAAWVPASLKKIMIVEDNIGKIAGFDPQIILSLAIGIFHICLAMVVKTACATHRSGLRASLGTWGWTVLVVGGVICAAAALSGLLSAQALRWSVIVLGIVSALGIFPFNTPGRSPLVNVGSGLWDSYNMVTGLLGDVLSYIRLYALGLAGGMLGGVFNSLASMLLGDSPTWQWVPFLLIVVLGHALNLAMSCLGAFVHPLRLSFVEYFKNSGYEGRGVKYRPLENNNQ